MGSVQIIHGLFFYFKFILSSLRILKPSRKGIEATATTQITASVIVTAILTPILTAYIAKKFGNKKQAETQEA